MFDKRLLRVGVEINGQVRWYSEMQISVSATKFANPMQNEATVKITNMRKDAREYILTETTPFNLNRTRKKIIVEAGRQSTGYYKIFEGDIMAVTPSQPPDIMLTFACKSNQWDKGIIVSKSMSETVPMSAIAKQVADTLGVDLVYEAKEKNISNFNFTGAALRQVDKLAQLGKVNAFMDDGKLVVTDFNVPISSSSHVLSMETGLIGIPQINEQGVQATMLLTPSVRLGGELVIESKLNPTASGKFSIFKLNYELTNRDDPFYIVAEGKKFGTFI